MLNLANMNVVAIHQLVVLGGEIVQKLLDRVRELLHFAAVGVRSGDVPERLDVNVHVDRSVAQLANALFEIRRLAMGVP